MEFKEILSSMFENMPSDLDTREGSVLYTVSAPAAYELAKAYWVLTNLMNLMLPDTSTGEYLERLTAMFGVDRKEATYAQRKIETFDSNGAPMEVDIGSRFRVNDLSLEVFEEISKGAYKARAEQSGVIGNNYVGPILPISNIDGLGSAMLSDVLIMAQDQEADEDLRERFYAHVREAAFAGNIPDYVERTLNLDGVGAVSVIPIWDGPGTVLLLIGDENERSASTDLVKSVQDYYQPLDNPSIGMAPIGHTVTVKTSNPVPINVSATITLDSASSYVVVEPLIESVIMSYIDSIKFEDTLLYTARLTAKILDVNGVLDVSNVLVNGTPSNLEFEKTATNYETPGEVTFNITEG